MASHPWERVLHKLCQHKSFPQDTIHHEPCQHGSFQGIEPFRNWVFQHGSSLSSQALHEILLWCEISKWSQCPLDTHLLQCVIIHRLQMDICSTMEHYERQVNSLPHQRLLHELQGNTCSGSCSISSPYFFPDLGVGRTTSLKFYHCFPLFFTFSKYIIPEALPTLLIGSSFACSGAVLEPDGTYPDVGAACDAYSQKPLL